MQARNITTILFLLSFCFQSFAFNDLYVLHPETSNWWHDPGTIEEATIELRPKGLFTQVDLFLTMSARNTPFENYDNVEIVLDFDLPENSLFIDSWLWFNGEIIVADLIDRWTANQIYESYVQRNTDPSLLVKDSPTQYQLRVFPLMNHNVRKVKISYLVPTDWTVSSVSSVLPANILNTTLIPTEKIEVKIFDHPNWTNPKIVGLENMEWMPSTENGENLLFTEFDFSSLPGHMSLVYDSPMDESGVYVEKTPSNEDDGFYQMAVLPSKLLDVNESKRVLFLVDFEAGNSTEDNAEVIATLSDFIQNNIAEEDEFNIMLSCGTITQISVDWIDGSAASIEAAIADLSSAVLCNETNLPVLVMEGIDFINSKGLGGSIMLCSNAGIFSDEQLSDVLLDFFLAEMEETIPINICDFQTTNFNFYWIDGQDYSGSEHLYIQLAQQTGGSYLHTFDEGFSLDQGLEQVYQNSDALLANLDIYTSLEDGVCYSRINIGNNEILTNLNKPILQIGAYYGQFPFEIELSGLVDGQVYSQQITTDGAAPSMDNNLVERAWMGLNLAEWESPALSNEEINTLIDLSMQHRVLTSYTAFLCVEPDVEEDDDWLGDGDGEGDDVVLAAEDVETSSISVFPNPFSHSTTIQIDAPENTTSQSIEIEIFDMLGQKVHQITSDIRNEQIQIEWNAEGLASGIYIIVIRIGDKVITKKVQYIGKA